MQLLCMATVSYGATINPSPIHRAKRYSAVELSPWISTSFSPSSCHSSMASSPWSFSVSRKPLAVLPNVPVTPSCVNSYNARSIFGAFVPSTKENSASSPSSMRKGANPSIASTALHNCTPEKLNWCPAILYALFINNQYYLYG